MKTKKLNFNFLLHLTLIDGVAPSTIKKIMQSQRSDVNASDLYHLSASDWTNYFGITEQIAQKLVAGLSDVALLEKELHLIEQHKIQLITIADDAYPVLLKEIHSPPAVLYYQGDFFSQKNLAVVGSRKASAYGQKFIDAIIPDLVNAGYAIVSGGALGIDTMAHEAALACGGKTIAILGSGLLRLYPHQNKLLFKKIIDNGGIVASSYPLMMEPLPHNFPARNRIVTGLSQGCVVVQAAQKSGALISAHCALEQGREVFAVPGHFDDVLSAGCHEIIQQGAKLVMSSADILSEFGEKVVVPAVGSLGQVGCVQDALQQQILFSSARTESVDFSPLVLSSSKDALERSEYSAIQKQILRVCKNATSLDDIIAVTQLSFEQVQSELFNLQLDGIVSQDFTGMWVASKC